MKNKIRDGQVVKGQDPRLIDEKQWRDTELGLMYRCDKTGAEYLKQGDRIFKVFKRRNGTLIKIPLK